MKKTLFCSVATATLVAAGSAPAQAVDQAASSEAQPAVSVPADTQGETDDIVVTGFRASLDRAAAIKRSSDSVSDVIAAEDIGKYPDVNIAESLQRVTGVQITRNRGAGGTISVRGLSPSFVSTTLNGRLLVSGSGRTFDFLTLSPDFVSAVEVRKSPTPDILDGGLSATVDVRTPRPLAVGKTTVAGRAEGVIDNLRKALGPRLSAIGNYVNAERTFGVSLGLGFENIKNRTIDQSSYGAEVASERGKNVDYNGDGDLGDTYAFDHAQSFYQRTGFRRRVSAVGGVQWKPADTIEIYGDALYTHFRDYADQPIAATRFTNIAPATPGAPFGVRNRTIDTRFNDQLLQGAQGFLTSMDVDGLDYRADGQPNDVRNRIMSGALGAAFDFDRFHLRVEGNFSQGRSDRDFSQASSLARASASIARPDGLGGQAEIGFNRGFNPLDPNNFAFVLITRSRFFSQDEISSGRADMSYDVGDGFVKKLSAGAVYSNRHLFGTTSQSIIDAPTAVRLSNGKLTFRPNVEGGSINAAPFLSQINVDTGIPRYLQSFLAFDYDKFYSIVPRSEVDRAVPFAEQLGGRLDVTEKTWAGYVRADFADTADRLSGNIGARLVNTRLVSRGFASDLDNLTFAADAVTTIVPPGGPVEARNAYTYVLPSLNLKYNVDDALAVRLAAARVLARPDFGQLGVGLSVNANVLSIFAANPDLKPYLSDQLDLSFEYYLPNSGLVSLALFYKSVSNFIVNGQVLDTRQVRRANGETVPLTFRRNQPINLETVELKGVEFGAQLPAASVTSALAGFGVFGNGTYIDAPLVPAEQNGLPFPLPGVSKFSYNVGAYFEKAGFGARAFYNWRGRFETGAENYFGDRQFQRAYGQVDGSISYDVTPAITTSVDVSNLFNAPQRQTNNFGLARLYQVTGRIITFGIRARY